MTIFDNKTFDLGVIESLHQFFFYGWLPGSFGVACLLQDYDLAFSKAHVKLRMSRESGEDIIENMIAYAGYFPVICRENQEAIYAWNAHEGIHLAPVQTKLIVKLSWDETVLGRNIYC